MIKSFSWWKGKVRWSWWEERGSKKNWQTDVQKKLLRLCKWYVRFWLNCFVIFGGEQWNVRTLVWHVNKVSLIKNEEEWDWFLGAQCQSWRRLTRGRVQMASVCEEPVKLDGPSSGVFYSGGLRKQNEDNTLFEQHKPKKQDQFNKPTIRAETRWNNWTRIQFWSEDQTPKSEFQPLRVNSKKHLGFSFPNTISSSWLQVSGDINFTKKARLVPSASFVMIWYFVTTWGNSEPREWVTLAPNWFWGWVPPGARETGDLGCPPAGTSPLYRFSFASAVSLGCNRSYLSSMLSGFCCHCAPNLRTLCLKAKYPKCKGGRSSGEYGLNTEKVLTRNWSRPMQNWFGLSGWSNSNWCPNRSRW